MGSRNNLFQTQTLNAGPLNQLKDNIRREINDIPHETFPKVMRNMAVCMQSVIGQHGRYAKNII